MRSVEDIRRFYELPQDLWTAFIATAGDPGSDMKLLAVLPHTVVAAALERALLPDGSSLSAVQASHVGLCYQLAKRILHTRGGGDYDAWKEESPFADQRAEPVNQAPSITNSDGSERKLKMSAILDQSDDGDFIVQSEVTRAGWYQTFVRVTGGWPQEEEDPSVEQVSALQRRLQIQGTAPFVDFAVWVPDGQKAMKASKFRSYVLTASGYTTKELPGPSTFVQWRSSYRILRTALVMLDTVTLAALHNYEMAIEKLTGTYPTAWHLIYAADELARSAHSNRIKARVQLEIRSGKAPPQNWDANRPWDYVFMALVADDKFWQDQVHTPALTWLASGSTTSPRTPAEQLAMGFMQGGIKAIAPNLEPPDKGGGADSPEKPYRRGNKRRRGGKGGNGGDSKQSAGHDDNNKKGAGKTKQKCFAWNNNNGSCAGLPPGAPCAAKVKREHRCTICNSPGHPSSSCPNKKE